MISRLEALNVALRHRPVLSELMELRQDPLIPWRGSLSEAEHELLKRAVEKSDWVEGPIVEVGTLFGFTTAMIASWMNSKNQLITVDNYCWNPWGLLPAVHRALTRRVVAPFLSSQRVKIADMTSEEFFSTYAGPSPSLVFLDGDHSYQAVYNEIAWAKKSGASLIAGHDYDAVAPGVIQAVDEHFPDSVLKSETVWVWGL